MSNSKIKNSKDISNKNWNIINAYFNNNKNYFTKSQLDSYNYFINNRIQYTIRTLNENKQFQVLKDDPARNLRYEIQPFIGGIKSNDIKITKPVIYDPDTGYVNPLYPNEARLKDYSYMIDLYANITLNYKIYNTKGGGSGELIAEHNEDFDSRKIAEIPIMLQSNACILNDQPVEVLQKMGECPFDQGGYFIIDGKEKVIIAQELIATNNFFVEFTPETKIEQSNYKTIAYIRATSQENILFPKTTKFYIYKEKSAGNKANAIVISCPRIGNKDNPKPIPLFIMFRALGIESDREILKYIIGNDVYGDDEDKDNDEMTEQLLKFLEPSIRDGNYMYKQEQVMEYLKVSVDHPYKNIDMLRHIIVEDFLPNVGANFIDKAYFLGYLTNKLIRTQLGMIIPTQKDNYLYKRVNLSGYLLSNLFRDRYNEFRNKVRSRVDRIYNTSYPDFMEKQLPIQKLIQEKHIIEFTNYGRDYISHGLKKSMKGDWMQTREKGNPDPTKSGISQELSRLSYLGYVSHVRRIKTPIDPSLKLFDPHKLMGTHYGAVCPVESPDGHNIGLMKHFPMLTLVSFDIDENVIYELCRDFGMLYVKETAPQDIGKMVKVMINKSWAGVHNQPDRFYRILKLFKRHGVINQMISIAWNIIDNEILIHTDAGRIIRPLYVVENDLDYSKTNKTKRRNNYMPIFDDQNYAPILASLRDGDGKYSWDDLIYGNVIPREEINQYKSTYLRQYLIDRKIIAKHPSGIDGYTITDDMLNYLADTAPPIEYIDIDESNCGLIAFNYTYLENSTRKYTHCELHPTTAYSAYANIIPFFNCNMLIRNVFGAQQGKQAIGVYATNFNNRIDTSAYVIHHPQRALVHTKYSKYTHNDELPNGENLIVAIMVYTGYNQEDSILVNRSSISNGMFNITKFKAYIDEEDESIDKKNRVIFKNPVKLHESGENVAFSANREKHWEKIDENGLPKVNVYIDEGDVMLGKVKEVKIERLENTEKSLFTKQVKETKFIDSSVAGDKSRKGFIDRRFVYKNEKNMQKVKIRMRKMMQPEMGDKMCIRESALVLTDNGWIPFKNIDISRHKIATVIDNELRYVRANKKYEYECINENMWYLRGDNIEMVCTMEHKVIVQDRNIPITCDNTKAHAFIPARYIIGRGEQHNWFYYNWATNTPFEAFRPVNCEEGFMAYTGVVGCFDIPRSHMFLYKETEYSPECWTGNSSRHGQKGVCGMIYNREDMPFTADGVVPDIIVNPHAIPSRMTIGHLVEGVMAKLGCKKGCFVDATAFDNHSFESFYNEGVNAGLHRYGNEIMYNPITGEQLDANIFLTPTYYYRLKHIVSDKINYRHGGGNEPRTALERQPTQGRANGGGLRIGEMESNSILAHGTAGFLKEKMLDHSDKSAVFIDNKQGEFAIAKPIEGNPHRTIIKRQEVALESHYKDKKGGAIDTNSYSLVQIPYAMQLLINEMGAMGIKTNILTEKNTHIAQELEKSNAGLSGAITTDNLDDVDNYDINTSDREDDAQIPE